MAQTALLRPHGRSPGPVRSSLTELGRRATRGDRVALDDLLRTVQAPVLRYLTRRLAQHPDGPDIAGDLRQEVLLRAASAVGRCHFEDDRRLLAWVLSITRNVLVDYIRGERARDQSLPGEALERVAERASLAAWQSGRGEVVPTGPLDRVASLAMAGLPAATVELLRLRVQLGLTWPEVARAMGITASAAKRRYQRAQTTLRARFLAALADLPPEQREPLLRTLRLEERPPRAESGS